MTEAAALRSGECARDAFLIALISVMLALVLRAAGSLQGLELAALDSRIKSGQSGEARHVTLVLESEEDIQRFGHPLPDGALADALARLTAAGASVVTVDKFRDMPVPPGSDKLDNLLRDDERIIWVTRFGLKQGRGVPAPLPLRETDRTGCADLQPDVDGVNRRALLAQEDGGESCLSLSLATAAHALALQGREFAFDGSERLQLGVATLSPLALPDGFSRRGELGGFQIAMAHPVSIVPTLRLQRVLEGKLPDLKGQVVFIGTSAVSLGDRHLVPDSRGSEERHIPGVEVHARITEELLRLGLGEAFPIRHAPLPVALLILLVCALAGAWAGLCSASTLRGLQLALGVLVLLVLSVLVLDRLQWRMEVMAPGFGLLMAVSLGWARRAQIEKRDRTQLRELFSRQVAPEVAEAIWNQRAAFFREGRVLPMEARVTVLFADLRGFTSVTEQLDREVMVTWLNGAVAEMTEAVMESGGVVTRFGGDQVMAVFGVPAPRTDENAVREDAANAVRAALRMRDRLARLNDSADRKNLPPARVRIGIQSGLALQCGVGSRDRFEFTVLGDAVNTASRLESLAGDDDGSSARIFAGGDTITLCGARFQHEAVAELKLKGKDIPVAVYRIAGELE